MNPTVGIIYVMPVGFYSPLPPVLGNCVSVYAFKGTFFRQLGFFMSMFSDRCESVCALGIVCINNCPVSVYVESFLLIRGGVFGGRSFIY